MSPSADGNPQKKSGLTEDEKGLPFRRGENPDDGQGEELADRREEGREQARVRTAVREFMGNRKRRKR